MDCFCGVAQNDMQCEEPSQRLRAMHIAKQPSALPCIQNPFVRVQLGHKARVGVDAGPPALDVLVCLLVGHAVLLHEVGHGGGRRPTDAHLTVYQDL